MRISDADPSRRDHRLERLIERLPAAMRLAMRWMWQPSARLVRIPQAYCSASVASSAYCRSWASRWCPWA
jgi:hypothetical protein